MGAVCDQCQLYNDSILHTIEYGSICNDCSLKITLPYITHVVKEIESQINGTKTEGDKSLAEEIDHELVDKLEELIMRDKRQEEETKDWPVWHNGIEYANMEEYRKLTGRV